MNEFEFIAKIAEGVPRSAPHLLLGIDDDCAVIDGPDGMRWLVTSDLLAEDVHFKREWFDGRKLGAKALTVNVSDIAAMGGAPKFYFVSIAVPEDLDASYVLQMYDGMKEIAKAHGMTLAGGDTSASKKGLFISITVIGSAKKNEIIYRKGAGVGDLIYLSGKLGGSTAGLECLIGTSNNVIPANPSTSLRAGAGIQNMRKALDSRLRGNDKSEVIGHALMKGERDANELIERHRSPIARVELGLFLSKNGLASSMIDISDGLLQDLGHIADLSNVGFKIYAEKVPVMKGVTSAQHAFAGGEEYELIFTVKKDKEELFLKEAVKAGLAGMVTKIGEIVEDKKTRALMKNGREMKVETCGHNHSIGK